MRIDNLASWAASALALSIFLLVSGANAFCRTTSCNPQVSCTEDPGRCCIRDRFKCESNGTPLAWPNSCVSYNVYEKGSARRDISALELSQVVKKAFDEWLATTCDGEPLSLAVDDRGFAECGQREYNPGDDERNANVWMLRDDFDPAQSIETEVVVDSSALAVSIVSFDPDTAELYDVDVEIYSGAVNFTTGDETVDFDLRSVVTHEAGHFLGLDHTPALGATMISGYTSGDTRQRTLEQDDRDGVCAVYPPDREITKGTCEPRGRYSPLCAEHEGGCNCRSAPRQGAAPTPFAVLSFVAALFGFFARRRKSLTVS